MNTTHHAKKISIILLSFLVLFGASVTSAQTCDSATQYCRDLSVGTTGDDVVRLKTLLKSKGFFGGKTSQDTYNKAVKSGVEKLQQENGLPVTGVVDSGLRTLLNSTQSVAVVDVENQTPKTEQDILKDQKKAEKKLEREQKKAERALLKEQKKEERRLKAEAKKLERKAKSSTVASLENQSPVAVTTGTVQAQATNTQQQASTTPVSVATPAPVVATSTPTAAPAPTYTIPVIPQITIPEIAYSGTATSGYKNDIVFLPKVNEHGMTGGLILNTSYSSGTPGVLPKFVYSPTIVFASTKFGYLPTYDGKVYSQQPVLRFQTLIKNPNNSYGLIELKSPKLDCVYVADSGEKYDLGKNYLNVSSLKFNEYGVGNGGWVMSLASDYVPTSSHKIYQTAGLKLVECKMTYSELKDLDDSKTVSSTDNTANNVISMYVNIVK